MNDAKVRIFVSSPADVEHERAIVKDIIERLAQEFLPYFDLEPVLWEEEALTADRTFQAGLVQPSDCDIVLVVLWTRLGSPLPQEPYEGMTGTEWEFFDAVEGKAGDRHPEVLVYKKTNPKLVDITNPLATLAAIEDRKRLEEFFQRNFFNEDQTFRRAFRIFDSDAAFRNLVEVQLRKLLNRRIFVEKRGAGRAFEWHGSPFRPGRPFDFGDERIFTGRESESRDLIRRLQEQMDAGRGFLLVSGPSGCGKSSLVRAGLLPRLVRPHQIEGVAACRWCIVDPRQGDGTPLAALSRALCAPEVLGDALSGFGMEATLLRRSLEAEPELAAGQIRAALQGLTGAIRDDTGDLDSTARLMVVIDPLEPVFEATDPALFGAALQALAQSGAAWVVAVVRSDHLCHLPRLGTLARISDSRAWLSLEPPASARVRQVIEIPALVAGLEYEARGGRNLVEQLESEVARLRLWPPLLQGALDRVYRSISEKGNEAAEKVADSPGYPGADTRDIGRLAAEALRRADELWSQLGEEVRGELPRLCRALTTLDPGAGVRPLARTGDLDSLEESPSCRHLIRALIDARLVVAEGVQDPTLLKPCPNAGDSIGTLAGRVMRRSREEWMRLSGNANRAGEPAFGEAAKESPTDSATDWRSYRRTVLLAHPVLMERWAPMREWLSDAGNLESLALRYQITRQAQLWKRTDCNQEYLLGEAGYAAARRFASRHGEELEPAEAELLEQSGRRLRLERRRNRLVRFTGVVLAVLLLVATGAAFWARDASNTATVNLQRSRLNAADLAIARGNTPRAVVLALDAGGWLPRQALQTLSRAFTANRLIALLHQGEPDPALPLSAAIDARGERAVTLDPAVGITTWRLDHDRFVPEGPAEMHEPRFHRVIYAAHPDGGVFLALAPEGAWILPIEPGTGPQIPCGTDPGTPVEVSPDGRFLALAHALAPDRYGVCVADLDHQGRLTFDSEVHREEIRSLSFSADATRLVTASQDGDAKVLDIGTGEVLLTLPPQTGSRRRPIGRAIFSPSGEQLAIVSTDDSVWLYQSDGTQARRLFEMETRQGPRKVHDSDVQDMAFTPDGRYLIAADQDGQVVRWGLGEDESTLVLGSHEQTVVTVRVSPDGTQALTASLDRTARLWDIESGKQIATFSHDGSLSGASFTADGARIASLSAQDGTARLWSKTPISYLSQLMPHQAHVSHVVFSPEESEDRLRLATASYDGQVKVWDFHRQNGKLIAEQPRELLGHDSQVRRLAFSARGDLLVSAGYDGTARIWSMSRGRELGRELCRLDVAKEGAPARVQTALFQPRQTAEWVLTASNDPSSPLVLWDTATCARIDAGEALAARGSAVAALDAIAAGDGVLVATGSEAGRVRVMHQDRQGGWELLCDLTLHGRSVLDIAFSPDGSQVASAGEDHWGHVLTVDGCGGNSPQIVDLAGHADAVRSVRFFPDGQRLVTGSLDRTARVWEADGELVQVLAGHDNFVHHAESSPDGNWILTASRDGTIGFWQNPGSDAPAVTSPYLVLSAELKGVTYASFSPNGRYIGAGYWRDASQLWRVWADGDHLDAAVSADLRDVWGPKRANLVLVREAERFRRENRLEELMSPDEEGD